MTVTLELTPEMEVALQEEAQRHGLTPQVVMETLVGELRDRRVPQSLDEIKPRRLPPPGKTAMQMVYQKLPADESDEEIRQALEELS